MAGAFPESTSKTLVVFAILIWIAATFNMFTEHAGQANIVAVLLLLIAVLLVRRRGAPLA